MNSSDESGSGAWWSVFAGLTACVVAVSAGAAEPVVTRVGKVSMATLPVDEAASDPTDYINAAPVKLPVAEGPVAQQALDDMIDSMRFGAPSQGKPGFSPGNAGDGSRINSQFLGRPRYQYQDPDAGLPQPAAFGTNNRPFTAARADGTTVATNTSYPWRAAGRLFATIGGSSGTCSASLIKRGLVVTAAHCVSSFGTGQIYTNIRYVPGYRNGQAPFGTWTASRVAVLTAYLNGTDQCSQRGVVCRNDVAVLTLAPQGGRYPGTSTGWFGYGWNGSGFTGAGLTHVTQLGYPSCLDNGNFMERNDAQGSVSASMSGNTVIGSLMCPGSSGGPWLINFGLPAALTGTTSGAQASANFVVGTTSWVSSNAVKDMGASPFTAANIVALVNTACSTTPAACAP